MSNEDVRIYHVFINIIDWLITIAELNEEFASIIGESFVFLFIHIYYYYY